MLRFAVSVRTLARWLIVFAIIAVFFVPMSNYLSDPPPPIGVVLRGSDF